MEDLLVRLQAEIAKADAQSNDTGYKSLAFWMADNAKAIAEEIDQLRKDLQGAKPHMERYEWLCSRTNKDSGLTLESIAAKISATSSLDRLSLAKAIDAAMAISKRTA